MSQEMPGNTMELIWSASGVVLDLGPGIGALVHHFDRSKITKAYGPEPAVDMHPKLQESIDKAGLTEKYEILSAGAEAETLIPALAKKGIIKTDGSTSNGLFDTIVCTRVLCGVPRQEETIEQLYRLLKPGGRMIICEHVISPWPTMGSPLGWLVQRIWILAGWNFWMGGCTLNRDTVLALKKAAGEKGWKRFDLKYSDPWHSIPFVVGTLEKA
jgi:SAM-dependent methyltransferase